MEKARQVKQANDQARLKKSLKQIEKANVLIEEGLTTTQACRKAGISVDKFYRNRDKLNKS